MIKILKKFIVIAEVDLIGKSLKSVAYTQSQWKINRAQIDPAQTMLAQTWMDELNETLEKSRA